MMFRDKMEHALFAFSSLAVPIRFLYFFIRQHGFLGAFHGSWRLEEGIGVFFFYLLLFADLMRSLSLHWLGGYLKRLAGKKIRCTNLQTMLLSRI